MTTDTLRKYLTLEHKMANLDAQESENRAEMSARLGLSDFWTSKDWSFKTTVGTVAISGGSVTEDKLPSNFASMLSIKETSTTQGNELQFLEVSRFNEKYPKPDALSQGSPVEYTVYYNTDDKRHYIKVAPIPAGQTILSMLFFAKPPEDASAIPAGFESGIIACAVKFLFAWGTKEHWSARNAADDELARLRLTDNVVKKKLSSLAPTTKQLRIQTKHNRTSSWLD